jgi:hypothetical protein
MANTTNTIDDDDAIIIKEVLCRFLEFREMLSSAVIRMCDRDGRRRRIILTFVIVDFKL